jgi:hypothetical protein
MGEKDPTTIFGAMTNFGLIFPITVVCIAGAIVPFKIDAIYKKSKYKMSKKKVAVISWITAIINTIVFLLLCMLMIASELLLTVVMFFSFMAISAAYYFIWVMIMKKRGIKPPGRPVIK